MHINDITGEILDAALALHRRLGPGLAEEAYERLLARDLRRRGLSVERQKKVVIEVEGVVIRNGARIDLLVEGIVVVEIKAIPRVHRAHRQQVLTYLRALRLPVGLLINFGAPTLVQGFHRIVNNYRGPLPSSPR